MTLLNSKINIIILNDKKINKYDKNICVIK